MHIVLAQDDVGVVTEMQLEEPLPRVVQLLIVVR